MVLIWIFLTILFIFQILINTFFSSARWVEACNRADKFNTKSALICSSHFADDVRPYDYYFLLKAS